MTDRVQKFIKSLDAKTREELKRRLAELMSDPYRQGQDIKKLKGWGKDVFRLRIGKIRIVYRIAGKQVTILAVDYRGNVY
jgi:mRNA interferase RelE/StbE